MEIRKGKNLKAQRQKSKKRCFKKYTSIPYDKTYQFSAL